MGLFSRSYVPGGEYHVRITDSTFQEAQEMIRNNSEMYESYKNFAREQDCLKYDAHDFPVAEIIGAFLLSYELQEEDNGIPEELRCHKMQLGRKDQVEFNKFIESYNESLQRKADYKQAKYEEKGLGGKLFSLATKAAVKGIAKAATGKSSDIREYEKVFLDYISGDSQKAREYMLKFAEDFGGYDDGLVDVSNVIRHVYWTAEFARKNRS